MAVNTSSLRTLRALTRAALPATAVTVSEDEHHPKSYWTGDPKRWQLKKKLDSLDPEFRDKVYQEKRDGGDYSIAIGKAQSEGFARLMDAMFDRVVPVAATRRASRWSR